VAPTEEPPQVIPRVDWVDGEPIIAREEVHKPSPVPRSLAIILVILASLTLAQGFIQQRERSNQVELNEQLLDRQQQLIGSLAREVDRTSRDQEQLTNLVAAILAGATPEERRVALEEFLAQQQVDRETDQSQDTAPEASPRPAPAPAAPSPVNAPPASQEQPQRAPAAPESSPPPPPPAEPPPPPKAVPLPGPTLVCVESPLIGLEICQ